MLDQRRPLLVLAAAASAAFSLFHLLIVFVSGPGYRYFGAGEELARMAEEGPLFPGRVTLGIAFVFAVFALYAFAGAGLLRPPPLLRLGLVVISGIYLLRGISAIRQGLVLPRAPGSFPTRYLVFSLVSLLVGLLYALGTARAWRGSKA